MNNTEKKLCVYLTAFDNGIELLMTKLKYIWIGECIHVIVDNLSWRQKFSVQEDRIFHLYELSLCGQTLSIDDLNFFNNYSIHKRTFLSVSHSNFSFFQYPNEIIILVAFWQNLTWIVNFRSKVLGQLNQSIFMKALEKRKRRKDLSIRWHNELLFQWLWQWV